MAAIVFNMTTFALLALIFVNGRDLVGEDTIRQRDIPWYAVALTAVGVLGVLVQLSWSGAMDTSTATRRAPAGGACSPRCSCRTAACSAPRTT